jgi:tetratricopeptide (TPR) repeat protein
MGKVSRSKILKRTVAASESAPSASPVKGVSSAWLGSVLVHLALIAVLGLLAYSNTFDVPFQFDDKWYIVENPIIKNLGYFLSPSKAADFPKFTLFKNRFVGYLTFALNYRIHGLDVTGYHVVNLAIHIINASLVYFLVVLTFRTPLLGGTSLLKHRRHIALFSALLFVTHPVQTQAVTYIVQRFASLATFFYILSLVAYISARLSSQKAAHISLYFLSLVSAVLAMKTKEIAFTLPLAVALYEFMFFKGRKLRRMLWLFPLFLTMLIIPLTLIDTDRPPGELIGDVGEATKVETEMSRLAYLFTELKVITTYVRLLFLPVNQNLDYDYPLYVSLFEPPVLLSFLFLLGIFGLGVFLYYRSRITHYALRLCAFGIFWFFLTLSVESSVIPILDVIFEHRVYLPSAGAFLALGTGAFLLMEKLGRKAARNAAVSLLVAAPLLLSAATYERNTVWKSEISLWEDVVRKSPRKVRGHYNLGLSFMSMGLTNKAIEQYQIAFRLKPDFAMAYASLGTAYYSKGLTDKAIEQYTIALRLRPDFAMAHYNLGTAYGSKGLADKAIEHFQSALRFKPDYANAHYNLGLIYFKKGLLDRARAEFEAVLKLNPLDREAKQQLERMTNE